MIELVPIRSRLLLFVVWVVTPIWCTACDDGQACTTFEHANCVVQTCVDSSGKLTSLSLDCDNSTEADGGVNG